VRFVWVKGHADNVENNRCDALAVQAANSPHLKTDIAYEKMVNEKPEGLL
jgi:ribonuclease HI